MATETQTTEAKLRSELERYEAFFSEIEGFIGFVRTEREQLEEAIAEEAAAKERYTSAKARTRALRDSIAGAKDSLYQMIEPGPAKMLPLFDRMEPADPEKHGDHASEWRKDPIAALRLSPLATKALIDSDIVAIGQLQDRVLDNPDNWWESIDGLSDAIAAAIVDKLNDFVLRDGDR